MAERRQRRPLHHLLPFQRLLLTRQELAPRLLVRPPRRRRARECAPRARRRSAHLVRADRRRQPG
jgi:hypothetical protein